MPKLKSFNIMYIGVSINSYQTPMSTNLTAKTNVELISLMKSYQADQQVKFLSLEAEINLLLEQLQNLKAEKLKNSEDN